MKKVFFLLTVLLALALAFLTPRLIKISAVECRSQFGPCSAYLSSKVEKINLRSLYKTKKDLAEMLGKEVLVSDFSVRYKIPDRIILFVIERKPKAAISSLTEGKYYLVDASGVVVGETNDTSLPVVVSDIDTGLKTGENVDEKTGFALRLTYEVFAVYQARIGRISENSLIFELPQGVKAIFPLEGDIKVLMGSLTLILSRLNTSEIESKIGQRGVSEVDLRYKNPIIR